MFRQDLPLYGDISEPFLQLWLTQEYVLTAIWRRFIEPLSYVSNRTYYPSSSCPPYHLFMRLPKTQFTISDFNQAISTDGSYPLVALPMVDKHFPSVPPNVTKPSSITNPQHPWSRLRRPHVSKRPRASGHPEICSPTPFLDARRGPDQQHPAIQWGQIFDLQYSRRS